MAKNELKLFSVTPGKTFKLKGKRYRKSEPKNSGNCVDLDSGDEVVLATMSLVLLFNYVADEVVAEPEVVPETYVSTPVEPEPAPVEERKSFFVDTSVNDNSTYGSDENKCCGGKDCDEDGGSPYDELP